jgi:PEP-CTERM motif
MRNLLCVLIALFVGGVAQADTIYPTAAAWDAAVQPGFTTINFEGIAPLPANFVAYPSGSTAVGGVTFSVGPNGTDGLLFVDGDGSYGYAVASISSQVNGAVAPDAPVDLRITLPHAVQALSFDFGDLFGNTATITLSNGATLQELAGSFGNNTSFYGVTAAGGVTWVDITEPAGSYLINLTDFSYGSLPNNNSVPEPSSLLLIGAGLVAVAGISRRRRTS